MKSAQKVIQAKRELDAKTAELFDQLDRSRPDQLEFEPAPGSWSILQVAQHLLLAEEGIARAARKKRGPASRTLKHRLGHFMVRFVLRTGIKVKAPPQVAGPPEEPIPLEEVRERWGKNRLELEEVIAALPEEELVNVFFGHFVAGPLDYARGLEFMAQHIGHHLRQIERIRKSPDFPAGAADTA